MAITHIVNGPTLVTYNSVNLGYTRDGARIVIEPKWIDVPSDDWGGQSGAPADAQIVGAIARVTLDLTKYDGAEVRKLTSFVAGGAEGVLPVFGTLMRQDAQTASLVLAGTSVTWTFATAFPRDSQEVNKGTRYSTYMLGFECWMNSTAARVLFTEA